MLSRMINISYLKLTTWYCQASVTFPKMIDYIIFPQLPPPAPLFDIVGDESLSKSPSQEPQSWMEILLGDGFLLAVPKHRRTVEKKLNRRFGVPDYTWKPLVPRTSILQCTKCGHHKEAASLCPNCYERIKAETELIQNKIHEDLGLKPIEQDVVVLYEGERQDQSEEFWKGKRVVEMQKPRPAWFTKNLLEKTTQQPSPSTDVKPTELA